MNSFKKKEKKNFSSLNTELFVCEKEWDLMLGSMLERLKDILLDECHLES